jgi:hypothetical protein
VNIRCKRRIEGDFVALALRTTAINPPLPPFTKGGNADEVSRRITRLIFLDRGIGQTSVSPPQSRELTSELFVIAILPLLSPEGITYEQRE